MIPAILVNELSYTVNKTQILKACSLQVSKGDIMCIMGPNGCGKTTLLNCILGFNSVFKEKIYLNGTDICQMKRLEIAKIISYVQQATQNDSSLEVYDYLTLGRIAHKKMYETITQQDSQNIKQVAYDLGIADFLHKSLSNLSGGEKQLVMIARALIQDTEVIIMDEPASALDFGNQSLLLNLIKKLNSLGKTVVFSTHNPNHALALNSKVCIMNKGTTLAIGDVRECINSGLLQKIYGNSVRFITNDNSLLCSFCME